MIKRSKKAASQARMVRALDDDARQRAFERDEFRCVRCGKVQGQCLLQPCHVIGRRHKCVRWDIDNIFSGCAGCHMWWHEYPTLSGEWFRKNWPDRHERIVALYNRGGKVNVTALFAELKGTV